ncbi:hypothetical protein NMY3_00185 [Candidatus Nitrosocosmicus oleophilus]|uniref:Uncharacterized protein n=1 Tax=Candidatus Nitrosocosmicus oleophilus TaxID=1353260 RepID=A0A654LVJ8_9ARCH|nr:hypothetical protein NMY3_00185 [Candidatus Nitrosocosmicus oleophilus]
MYSILNHVYANRYRKLFSFLYLKLIIDNKSIQKIKFEYMDTYSMNKLEFGVLIFNKKRFGEYLKCP